MSRVRNFFQHLSQFEGRYGSDIDRIIGNAAVSFSTSGEDVTLLKIFENLAAKRVFEMEKPGFYVDLGAFHPYLFSNTFIFYIMGWRGLNVDANRDVVSLFQTLRPEDINVHAAITVNRGPVNYHRYKEGSVNGITGDTEKLVKGEIGQEFGFLGYETLEGVPVNDLLEQYTSGKRIDLLTMDIENMDDEVLHSIDFSRFLPSVIATEIGFDRWSQPEFLQFMSRAGYRFHSNCCHTVIFVREF